MMIATSILRCLLFWCFCLVSVVLVVSLLGQKLYAFKKNHCNTNHGSRNEIFCATFFSLLPQTALLLRKTKTTILPTPYPPSFRIHFDTNVTRQLSTTITNTITETSSRNSSEHPLRSSLYYDWSIKKQRIDHPPGSYECIRFYNTSSSQGCKLYFLPSGMYRVIFDDKDNDIDDGIDSKKGQENEEASLSSSSSQLSCCLDIPGLGAPPPDWARRANPTYKGLVHDLYSGYDAHEFVFDKNSNIQNINNELQLSEQQSSRNRIFSYYFGYTITAANTAADAIITTKPVESIYDEFHTTREVHDGTLHDGTPLLFTFPSKAKGLQDFHFDPTSLVVGFQNHAIFQLPEGCENVLCNNNQK